MALSNELLEKIGAYLSGQLPADEKARFDARLQQDTDLQQEVRTQRELKQGLVFMAQKDRFRQMHADLAARGLLNETESIGRLPVRGGPQTPVSNGVPEKRRFGGYGLANWAMAASLVLLLGVGWVIYRNQWDDPQTLAQNERVFNTFFSADLKPAPILVADPDRVAASPVDRQAIQDSVRLRKAVSALQQVDSEFSIRELTTLSVGRPGHWSASAQWYLALAYLRNNQPAEARSLLQTMASLNGHPYQSEASQLLRQLPVSPTRPK
jgi:anti-sigma factor RsiW